MPNSSGSLLGISQYLKHYSASSEMRKQVFISKKVINQKEVLIFDFSYQIELIQIARKLGARWSTEMRVWYVTHSKEKLREAQALFGQLSRVILKGFSNNAPPLYQVKDSKAKRTKRIRKASGQNLTPSNKKFLHDYVKYLRGKVLSESTVRTYYIHILDFLIYLNGKTLSEVNNRDVELFVEDICVKRKYSVSTHRQVISAVKQFAKFQPCTIENLELERPRKSRFLPTVLSKQEVIDLLRSTRNIKHRTILALLYSSGLRIGELINLELNDLDIDRRQIIVRSGKGRKDRYVMMAETFAQLLQNYLLTYSPKKYFVEGLKPMTKYSATSVRSFLNRSLKRARINKKVTPHTLRHSYATHLLEQGVDIRYIQELLGHARPETTMIYTHVSKRDTLKIESPLDTLIKQLTQPNNNNNNNNTSLSQNNL